MRSTKLLSYYRSLWPAQRAKKPAGSRILSTRTQHLSPACRCSPARMAEFPDFPVTPDLAKAIKLPGRAIVPGLDKRPLPCLSALDSRTHRTPDFFGPRHILDLARQHVPRREPPFPGSDVFRGPRMAFIEMALSGITTAGEFHYLHHGGNGVPFENRNLMALQVLRAAADVGLRIALLQTAYVRAGWRKQPDPGQARFITPHVEDFIRNTDALRSAARPARKSATWAKPPSVPARLRSATSATARFRLRRGSRNLLRVR